MSGTDTGGASEVHAAERKALEERQAAELSSAIAAAQEGETSELTALQAKHAAEMEALEAKQATAGQTASSGSADTPPPASGTTSTSSAAAETVSGGTQSTDSPPGYAPYQHVGMGLHGSPPPSSSASTSSAAEDTASAGTQSAATEPASSAATPADNAAVTVSSGGTVTSGTSTSADTASSGETESETPASYGVAGLELLQQAASGFAIWHWDTAAASMSEALTSKDLDAAVASFRDGDVVHITASDGSAMRSVKLGHGALVWLRPVI